MWTYKYLNLNIKWKKLNVLKFFNFQFKLLIRFLKIISKGFFIYNVVYCVLEFFDYVIGESIFFLNCVLFIDKIVRCIFYIVLKFVLIYYSILLLYVGIYI